MDRDEFLGSMPPELKMLLSAMADRVISDVAGNPEKRKMFEERVEECSPKDLKNVKRIHAVYDLNTQCIAHLSALKHMLAGFDENDDSIGNAMDNIKLLKKVIVVVGIMGQNFAESVKEVVDNDAS